MSGRNTTRRRKRSPEPAEDIISLFDFGSDVEGGPAGEADPEFAPGKYEYDQKPTRKRRKTAAIGRGALAKWFGNATYRRSSLADSDEEAFHADAEPEAEDAVKDEEEDEGSEGSAEDTSLPPPKIIRLPNRPRQDPQSQSTSQTRTQPPAALISQSQNKEEGSTTESDHEDIVTPPFVKQVKSTSHDTPGPDNGTATESDPEFAELILSKTQTQSQTQTQIQTQTQDEGTATESESDHERPDRTTDGLRPAFPRKPDQPLLGPLILDDESVQNPVKVPGAQNTYLREYQREGIRFFYRQYLAGKGALLGDDMGLGKTIQVIGFLSAIMSKSGALRDINRRRKYIAELQDGSGWRVARKLPPANAKWPTALIIAPSSVIYNWEREFQIWGYYEVGVYSGTKKEREEVLKNFVLGRLDLVIMSFETARKDIELIDTLAWSIIVVDEAHRIKNPDSDLTQAFAKFRSQMRIGLTGTAIQNGYEEFWTILDWVNPGAVGQADEWKTAVSDPLRYGQSKKASEEERARYHFVARTLHDKLLPEFWLRRTKEIIKHQMPKKTDNVVFCPLSPAQLYAYKRIRAIPRVQCLLDGHPEEKGDLLRFLDTLIKVSNHVSLVLPSPDDNQEQVQRNREMAAMIFPENRVPKYAEASLNPNMCGKWLVLETLLRQWRKDPTNKVLIFTKSVKLIGILEFLLKKSSYGFLRLDGSVKASERMPLIDKFHSDPEVFVFLISTLTGGVGLNLTGANKVVIFDPNWNPAHDLQAMDRAYRFGQTRDVSVYRLLGAGSLEENIYARQLYKQQQMAIGYDASIQTRYFAGIQPARGRRGVKGGELFGLANLFALSDQLTTKMAIEKAHITELDWALANVDSMGKIGLAQEAKKVGVDTHLSTLGALLMEDGTDDIAAALRKQGIKYSHHNDKILVENPAEKIRTKEAVQRKQVKLGKKEATTKPSDVWPPPNRQAARLRKLAVPQAPRERLLARRDALIQLGHLKSPDDLAQFAESFAQKSKAEQQDILARLDRHISNADT